jgi:rubrerythrin
MGLLGPLFDRLLNARMRTVVYECRDCGTSFDSDRESCPNCHSEAITSHDIT